LEKKDYIEITNLLKKKAKKKYLIFIPAYNVEKTIYKLFCDIPKKIFKVYKVDIIIINDLSSDQTNYELIKIKKKFNYKIIILNNKEKLNYGGVQKKAFNYSIKKKYDYVIMLHGDGQYSPKKLPNFLKLLATDKYDAVFGTRMFSYYSALSGGMPLYKLIGNICLTKVQNFILNTKISEFHSGYRSYKIKSLKKINFNKLTNQFHFDTEIIIKFLLKKFSIKEIPIPTIYGEQVSHLKSIPYGLNILKVMFRYIIQN